MISSHLIPHGWKRVSLTELAEIQTGLAKGKKKIIDPLELPYLRVANVQDGYLDLREIKLISISRKEVLRYELRKGDVLMTEGGDFDKLGRGFVWEAQIAKCVHQNHVFVVRTNTKKLNPYFLSYQAGSWYGKGYFLNCSKQSTNLASINSTQLKQFPVLVPPIYEQNIIVEKIKIWDKAIAIFDEIVNQKQKLRQALLQQLLTGTRRFPGYNDSWNQYTLSQILTPIRRAVPKPAGPYNAVGIRSHGKGTFSKHVEDPGKFEADELNVAEQGDLIINITFAWEGAIAIVPAKHHGYLVSHRFPTYLPNSDLVYLDYLRYLIIQPRFRYMLGVISPGGAGRNRVLSKKDLLKLEITLPNLDEQKKISDLLVSADKEIQILENYLKSLQEQKKGLMQQLLTGKTRIKVTKVA